MMPTTIIVRAALFGAFWWVLTGGRADAWLFGAAVIALALAVSLRLQPPSAHGFSLIALLQFFVFFIVKSIKGGVQVAAMALRPRLDLQPTMLKIPLRLLGEEEQVFLISTLNLLPGTLSAVLEENCLQLHVLDARMPIEQDVRATEALVARVFRTRLS